MACSFHQETQTLPPRNWKSLGWGFCLRFHLCTPLSPSCWELTYPKLLSRHSPQMFFRYTCTAWWEGLEDTLATCVSLHPFTLHLLGVCGDSVVMVCFSSYHLQKELRIGTMEFSGRPRTKVKSTWRSKEPCPHTPSSLPFPVLSTPGLGPHKPSVTHFTEVQRGDTLLYSTIVGLGGGISICLWRGTKL